MDSSGKQRRRTRASLWVLIAWVYVCWKSLQLSHQEWNQRRSMRRLPSRLGMRRRLAVAAAFCLVAGWLLASRLLG